jgi:4-alpha-glucanotransferase
MRYKSNRRSGILVHPTCFESKHGIGDLGPGAYDFIDFLKNANQSYWQILPLGPTGYGDSPYQPFSSFAGQPLLISLDLLLEDQLLTPDDLLGTAVFNTYETDYDLVYDYKMPLLRKAFKHYQNNPSIDMTTAFNEFSKLEDYWLDDFALFMAVFENQGHKAWNEWSPEIANYTPASKAAWHTKLKYEVHYYKFVQFLFYKQWHELKVYANTNNIEIIGDVPIFVAYNSADVWTNKHLFYLSEDGLPSEVAGVPPDYFAAEGQLWGNPLYNWDVCKSQEYVWWFSRISHTLRCVDALRIDHFRGFESYWSVPYGAINAIDGTWKPGPGVDFFIKLKETLGDLPIIAEDLGIITKEVVKLRDTLDLPGMNVLQFAFMDVGESTHLPHNYKPNSVCYTGTHDNNTTIGWYSELSDSCKDKFRRYFNTDGGSPQWDLIRGCLGSVSKIAIIPIQDIIGQDGSWRMNMPGTPTGNWRYRFKLNQINELTTVYLQSLTKLYGRNIEKV